jgi:RHS repeat-associated protein
MFTRTSAGGCVSITMLDAHGRIVKQVPVQLADPITWAYDTRGRIAKTTQGPRSFTYEYDARDNVAARTDANGKRTTWTYDADGRPLTVRGPGGGTIALGYDARGSMESVKLPGGGTYRLATTASGRPASFQPYGSTLEQTWAYDRDRALTSLTLSGGRVREQRYDAFGRPAGEHYAEATTDVGYLDAGDRAATIARTPAAGGATQTLAIGYDGSLPVSLDDGAGRYTYSYDASRRIKAIKLVSGATTVDTAVERDADGLISKIGPFTWTRAVPGDRVYQATDGTAKVAWFIDGSDQVVQHAVNVGDAWRYSIALNHARDGLVTIASETVGAAPQVRIDYGYDDEGRLVSVKRDGVQTESYAYDADGNRVSRTLGAGAPETLTYDAQGRLAIRGGVAYAFDDDGFLTSRGGDHFTYSARGELLSATVGAQTVTYAYDGLGRRVSRTGPDDTTRYLYGEPGDSFRVTAVRDAGGVLTTYDYDEDGFIYSFLRGGTRYYVGTDGVGTPKAVVDGTGAVVKALAFDSFGNPVSDSAPGFALPFGFAGGLSDPVTGLVRFGMRDYEPASGRWTARDPALLGGGQPNLYAYAGSSPVSQRDPTGLFCVGGSIYAIVGGGSRLCWTSEGFAVCVELGVGSGIELSAGGDGIPRSGGGAIAAIKAHGGLSSVGLDASFEEGCGWKPNVQAKLMVLGFGLSNGDEGLRAEYEVPAPGVGIEIKLAYTYCVRAL